MVRSRIGDTAARGAPLIFRAECGIITKRKKQTFQKIPLREVLLVTLRDMVK